MSELMSIHAAALHVFGHIDEIEWNSLIVNRREPHTYRAFGFVGDNRICLHRFDPCQEDDSFWHPHPWPCRVLVLQGEYCMRMGVSSTLENEPEEEGYFNLGRFSSYDMTNPKGWHSVIPRTTCYSLMINGKPWETPHVKAPTTKGKDLDKFTDTQMIEHISVFKVLLRQYLKDISGR